MVIVEFPAESVGQAFSSVIKRIHKKTGQSEIEIREKAKDGLGSLAFEEIVEWVKQHYQPKRRIFGYNFRSVKLQEGKAFCLPLSFEVFPDLKNFKRTVGTMGPNDEIVARLIQANSIPVLPKLLASRSKVAEANISYAIRRNNDATQENRTVEVTSQERRALTTKITYEIREEIIIYGFEFYCPEFKSSANDSFDDLKNQVCEFIRTAAA